MRTFFLFHHPLRSAFFFLMHNNISTSLKKFSLWKIYMDACILTSVATRQFFIRWPRQPASLNENCKHFKKKVFSSVASKKVHMGKYDDMDIIPKNIIFIRTCVQTRVKKIKSSQRGNDMHSLWERRYESHTITITTPKIKKGGIFLLSKHVGTSKKGQCIL